MRQGLGGAAAALVPAGFWRRFFAYFVDGIVQMALALAATVPLLPFLLAATDGGENGGAVQVVGWVLSLITGPLYYVGFESSRWQATPGKRLLGMAVVRVDGSRLSVGRAAARYFGRLLCSLTLGFGYLFIIWTRRKQGLHDMVAGTLVVRRR